MNASQLKYKHEQHHPDSYFFTRKTMKFFGDTMKNFGVYSCGPYWALYRKRNTSKGASGNQHWLFRKSDFKLMSTTQPLGEVIAEYIKKHQTHTTAPIS